MVTATSPLMHWNRQAIEKEIAILKNNHFVVLDIETTGLSPTKGARIIEIGAVRVVNGEVAERYQQFIDPEAKIYPQTTKLTGITNEMVAGQPTVGVVLPEFRRFIGDAVVVCHNAKFDWTRFLLPAFKSVGFHLDNDVLCTYETFKKADPGRGRGGYILPMLCLLFGIEIAQYHRAIDDAIGTAEALVAMQKELVDLNELEKVDLLTATAVPVEHTEVQVKRVQYWEKRVSSKKMIRRQYVSLTNGSDFGTVYFDIGTQAWYNKDFEKPLDFERVEKEVLAFLSLSDRKDLCSFKSKGRG